MTYAIISDIHGNYPALAAAIEDAKAHSADEYILIGDYTSRIPYDNEVVNTIRTLSPAHIIQGNGERHYLSLPKSKDTQSNPQFKPLYWSLNELSPKNLAYLLALPETAVVSHEDTDIYLAHSIDLFYRPSVIGFFHTLNFSDMMLDTPISHKQYLTMGKEALLSCPDALADILALPKGIHLFGHNHLQFHMEHEGRLFINPGSCGMTADWNPAAAYTLLHIESGNWVIQERRVEYDIQATIEKFTTSGYHNYAPVWSKAIQLQLQTGKEYFGWFVTHIEATKKRLGPTITPDEAWDTAAKTWGKQLEYIT